jgi:hypothetical protein
MTRQFKEPAVGISKFEEAPKGPGSMSLTAFATHERQRGDIVLLR